MGSVEVKEIVYSFDVSVIISHPTRDIALLKLTEEVHPILTKDGSSYRINFICLPEIDKYNNKEESAIISGFGQVVIDNNPRNELLRKTVLKIIPTNKCFSNLRLTEDYICGNNDKHITCSVNDI